VRRSGCAKSAEAYSALMDGALSHADRERVLAHLGGCPTCRQEVAELRELRRVLGTAPADLPAPTALSSRLVSIAGAPTPRSRPSPRRARRGAIGVLSLATAAAVVAGAGYLAAPATGPTPAVGDPGVAARAEFSAVMLSLPLGADAVAAVLGTGAQLRVTSAEHLWPAGVGTGAELSPAQAYGLLARAGRAEDVVSYDGVVTVSARTGGQAVEGAVHIDARAGQGSHLGVFTSAGQPVRTGSSPGATPGSRMVDSELIALVGQRYQLSGRTGGTVAGRPASVVEARPLGSGLGGPAVDPRRADVGVTSRWWVDEATGLLLRLESYDGGGALVLAAGFTSVTIGRKDALVPGSPLTVPTTTASLTVSSAPALSAEGWFCPEKLAGLSLVRLRRGEADAGMVHLLYSDGVQTVSVFEQRGRLPEALPGWQRDGQLSAYVRPGVPSLATWQAGSTVFTVVTGGSSDLLAAVVRASPGEAIAPRTTMDRVRAGWARILDPLAPQN